MLTSRDDSFDNIFDSLMFVVDTYAKYNLCWMEGKITAEEMVTQFTTFLGPIADALIARDFLRGEKSFLFAGGRERLIRMVKEEKERMIETEVSRFRDTLSKSPDGQSPFE